MRFIGSILAVSCLAMINHAVMAEELVTTDQMPAALQAMGTSDYRMISVDGAREIHGENTSIDIQGLLKELGLPNAKVSDWKDTTSDGTATPSVDPSTSTTDVPLELKDKFPKETVFTVERPDTTSDETATPSVDPDSSTTDMPLELKDSLPNETLVTLQKELPALMFEALQTPSRLSNWESVFDHETQFDSWTLGWSESSEWSNFRF